jgi:tripeptidyl-peptidase-1
MKGGASMAAPVVASIFTLINEERLAAGKSPVGFVNPPLYANPQMFNDITIGNQSLGDPCAGWKWTLPRARLRPSHWSRGTKI